MGATPTQDQIADAENRAQDIIDEGGSRWPGMSYEQGVVNAIRWMNGDTDEDPTRDEDDA
ncbi:MAG: hypothetical protein K0S70_85 [Microbacterium sp.]|jgi:hypothetical protein|nr:hypothetical protein [Microbacterium sp.]